MAQWLERFNLPDDKLIDKRIKTAGYFTGDIGTVYSGSFTTASLTSGNKEYYYNLQYSSADQIGVTYGHVDGSGSSDAVGQTKAIYWQMANHLLDTDEIEVGFCLTSSANHTFANRIKDVYFIIAERARMKDRMNKRYWTIALSGSTEATGDGGGTGSAVLHLTDNSATAAGELTTAGVRYDIRSGSQGALYTTDTTIYGHFYPRPGIFVLNGTKLSSSLPGTNYFKTVTDPLAPGSATFTDTGSGLAPDESDDADNAGKLARAIIEGGWATLRSEEDFLQVNYLCRIKAGDFNYTNNPTYVSGASAEWRVPSFKGDPHSFVSTVGLFDESKKLVAVGRLSKPMLKNRWTELIFKVRLTY